MSSVKSVAPQFLVDNLPDTIAFYEDLLGFKTDFIYEDFYASVSIDGQPIHLKCASKLDAQRLHQKSGGHLDAFISVVDAETLYEDFIDRGVLISSGLTRQPWGTIDFQVEDPEGYILCFSEDGAR